MAHFGSGIWSYTRRTTGPIFKVTVPAIMIRSLCRGLGRKTPAPNRSISKRLAPVAIISIAQQASPKVMGQIADLRAQLTPNCSGFESITGATTLRRTKLVIESTVVRTNPSSCSAIFYFRCLSPLKRSLAPGIVVTHHQDSDKDKHFDQRKLGEGKIVAHEDYRPGQQENRLHVEDQKQHRHDVVPDSKTIMSSGLRVDAAFVRPHLVFLILPR